MTLTVNGRSRTVDVDPATPLLYVLSDDLELRGPKFGCGLGQCGACTVIVERTGDPIVHHAGRQDRRRRDHDARGPRHAREAASDSAGVHRRAGRAVRLLPERRHPDRQGAARSESARHGRADSAGALGRALPVLCQRPDAQRDPPLCEGGLRMKARLTPEARAALTRAGFTRRAFLEGSGALVVSFAASHALDGAAAPARAGIQRHRQHAARCVDRDRAGRPRHGLHREVRFRSGSLHGADAAGCRRTARALRSRAADSVRHVGHTRSGHDVRAAVAPHQFQHREPGARGGDGARDAVAAGRDTPRHAG